MNFPRRSLAFSLAAVAGLALPTFAQPGSFTIAQHGQAVGTATVTFTPAQGGYDTTTIVRVAMQGLNYNLSKTEELSVANRLKHVQLSATVNDSAVNVTAAPDAAQFLLNVSANGRSSTVRLAAHAATVFLPDFDPGALDTLLTLAATSNNRGLWAILPKQSGAQAGSIVPIQLATYADLDGTIDGKPVAVHHLEATIAGAKTELFSGPKNQLLQAELPQQGFALVRKGFVLTPPTKAPAPPAAPPQSTSPPAVQSSPAAQSPTAQAPVVQQ
jgi:hypothetical protein